MEYEIAPVALGDIKALTDAYAASLTGPTDDFWESHILQGDAYALRWAGRAEGFFTLWENGDERYITAFYLPPGRWGASQGIFARVLADYKVNRAWAPTCDELFVSLCMDRQIKVEIQAYYFEDTPAVDIAPPQFGAECLHRVYSAQELAQTYRLTGDFFGDDITVEGLRSGAQVLWQMRMGDELLGYCVAVPNQIAVRYIPCGEIVLEKHRRRGVARSMQYHMAAWVRAQGKIPVGGCWYYNEASRNTFYSIGRYSKTRLLKIHF